MAQNLQFVIAEFLTAGHSFSCKAGMGPIPSKRPARRALTGLLLGLRRGVSSNQHSGNSMDDVFILAMIHDGDVDASCC